MKSDERSANLHPTSPHPFVRLPDLVIVDGGKGQLSAAMKELQRLGLHDLPIIGLAKEHEEIYRPERSEPLVLSHDDRRAEAAPAHPRRGAPLGQRLPPAPAAAPRAESILDDCPGVSQARKAALLREFGSVARLRRASAEEIAAVPGIGKGMAEQITTFLRERSN